MSYEKYITVDYRYKSLEMIKTILTSKYKHVVTIPFSQEFSTAVRNATLNIAPISRILHLISKCDRYSPQWLRIF